MSWVVIAGLIVGVHPLSYRVYVAVSFTNIAFGWWLSGDDRVSAVLTSLLALSSVILWRFSHQLGTLLETSVEIRHEKEILVVKLQQALIDIGSAQRTRSRFLAAASHDLLQPVHALLMLIGVLRHTQSEARRAEAIHSIELTTESIETMFRGLLDLARIDAGALTATPAAVRVRSVCQSVMAGYEMNAAQLGPRLESRCDQALVVRADAALLTRVMRNLVDNAVKFTPRGVVELTCEARGDKAAITVSDTGVGIHPDDLPHVTEAFFRGRWSEETQAPGVGLGLAVSAHMVAEMGGSMTIESSLGRGTTVRVLLERADDDRTGISSPERERTLRYRRVVLVEDDQAVRHATRAWLVERGCEVGVASSLAEASNLCRVGAFVPDLILADFHLAGSPDGLAVISALRLRFPGCPAALVTGDVIDPKTIPLDVTLLQKPLRAERLDSLLTLADTDV